MQASEKASLPRLDAQTPQVCSSKHYYNVRLVDKINTWHPDNKAAAPGKIMYKSAQSHNLL